ncbi:MAG: YdcF family protein [Leptolyngbya sp. SIO3F4]|nr:YdcF family protein [Leptolyngbya sp. SIO3F4]
MLLNAVLQRFITPSNTNESADVIVVLGRGSEQRNSRTLAAAQLWSEGRAPHIFMSGMTDTPKMINLAKEMGVTSHQVSGERCSQSTWENALFSQILLSSRGMKKILLITDDSHIVRATLTFRSFGFEVIPYPVHPENDSEQIQLVFREAIGLIAYGVSGKLQPPKAKVDVLAREEANLKIKEWKCKNYGSTAPLIFG